MSNHSAASPEITFAPEQGSGTKRIWQVFTLLSVVTIIELFMGYAMTKQAGWVEKHSALGMFFVGAICILSIAKAYYIVGVFMHLGSELRNFRLTIVTTLALFIWFIAAFLIDGNSWRNLRNTNAGSREAPKTEQLAPAAVDKNAKP
jgi:cytochrome c oxidase subunit IV